MMTSPAGSHRRFNPLLDEWILCSPHRLARPWQGQIEDAEEERRPRHDPECYLCPGNLRVGGVRNRDYTSTWAFDNDFPALLPDSPGSRDRPRSRDLPNSQDSAISSAFANSPNFATSPNLANLPDLANSPDFGTSPDLVTSPVSASTDAPDRGGQQLTAMSPTAARPGSDDLLVAEPVRGVCRVLCFSPRHDLTLARMSPAAIRAVVDAWAHEVATLGARDDIRYVQVFENKGAAMGCSNPHPHGQVWATDHIPLLPARKLATQRRYWETHGRGRDLLGDYLARELDDSARIVCDNEAWVALVPFWAVWPFETLVLPRARVADLPSLDEESRELLASIVARLTARYDNLFRCSFPYSMGWHGRPTDGEDHPWWRLHAVFLPPLLRSATVRKFLVGYELTAEPQRDLTPEQAAARLRALPDEHYLGPPA